jgi:hypothetical protein
MTKVWILTEEYNDYDQYGEYFVAVFANKPTRSQLMSHDVLADDVEHVLAGGGRRDCQSDYYRWWHLNEREAE